MKIVSASGRRRREKNSIKRKSKSFWIITCVVCVVLAAAAASILIYLRHNSGETPEIEEFRREPTPVVQQPDPTPVKPPIPDPTPEPTFEPTPEPENNGIREPDRIIDFEALFERNKDAIAWLSIPGTRIDYPVVTSQDNSDYLRRDLDGRYNEAGTLFTDMINNPGFIDRVTVIYGHNMRNGSMFADLHNFADTEFFNENREIKIYTPEGMRVYEIIAAYITDHFNILYETDYFDNAVWEAYINKIFNNEDTRANLLPKEVGENDLIITLSTCVRGADEQRFLVQGVLKRNAP